MKVMLLNGSPHEKGCTYTALEEIQRELKKCGVDSEILHVGQEEIHGCIGCRRCMGIACPALIFEAGRARVDISLCNGCGLCASVCPKGAIVKEEM